MLCTASALSATWRMLALISWIEEVEASTDSWREPALRATSSIEPPISRIDEEASSVARERLSTSELIPRIEVLMFTSREAVSSTASSVDSRPDSISWIASRIRSGTSCRFLTTSETPSLIRCWLWESAFSVSP